MSVVELERDERRGDPGDMPEPGPTLADIRDDSPRSPLPDPYRCWDPFGCAGLPMPHLHGTRPDGRRV